MAGHQQITREWWETRKNNFAIYISQFVLDEVSTGDPKASKKRLAVIENFEQLDITDNVSTLATAIFAKLTDMNVQLSVPPRNLWEGKSCGKIVS